MCPAQTDRLQALLADNDKVNLADIEPIPLPLEPQVRIRGIVPEAATLFKVPIGSQIADRSGSRSWSTQAAAGRHLECLPECTNCLMKRQNIFKLLQ